MNVLSKIKNGGLLLIGLTASTWGHAQTVNVGITAGLTTGTGIEVSKPLNNYLSVRADIYVLGSLSFEQTLEGNDYTFVYTPETNSLLVDIHPFKGVFYMTAGLVQQNINAKTTGQVIVGNYTFNDKSYEASILDEFTGTVGFNNSIAPYLGIGWSNRSRSTSGFAVSFEMGVIDVGTGKAELSIVCGNVLIDLGECSQLEADVAAEEAEINKVLNRKLFYPVLKLGLSYRF